MTITQKFTKQSIIPTGPAACELLLVAAHSPDNKTEDENLRTGAVHMLKVALLIDAKTAEQHFAKTTHFSLVLKSAP